MSISAAEFLKWCEVFNVVTGGAGPIITFPLTPSFGGTGVANNNANTLEIGAASRINQDVSTTGSPTFGNIKIDTNTIKSLNAGGNITLIADGTGNVDIFNPPASESSSINVNGFAFNTAFRVNDIGTTSPAQSIIHRHSTTLEPVLLFARANSDTDSHAAVTNGMALSSTYTAGWTGSQYSLFGQVRISADATGTINNTSAPGKLDLMVSPNGSITPVTALSINNAGLVSIGNLGLTGNTISSTNTNGNINFIQNGTGILNFGSSTNISNGTATLNRVQFALGGKQTLATVATYINSSSAAGIIFIKSRDTSVGGVTAVTSGDAIGQIYAAGTDGTATPIAGLMGWNVSGTVSTGIVPSTFYIQTANTSGVLTTALTISNAQVVTLANALPVASGGTGITSFGTGVATALGQNVTGSGGIALDTDSTFTPALSFGNGTTGITYTTQSGYYSRVGNTITFSIQITLSSKGSSTGSARIGGLPTIARAGCPPQEFLARTENVTFSSNVAPQISAGTTTLSILQFPSASSASFLTDTAFADTSAIYITGTYLV